MAKRKPGMTDAQWEAYRKRVARRRKAAPKWPQPPQKVEAKVGAVTAVVEAGPDKVLGTADDKVTLKKTEAPLFSNGMTKPQLLEVAEQLGLKGLSMRDTKRAILKALRAATK